VARWTIHELQAPIGTPETRGRISEGQIRCEAIPFLALRAGEPPAHASVIRSWQGYDETRIAIISGLDWAYTQNAHVYRLSLGLLPRRGVADDPLASAIRFLLDRNRLVVVAAGNWGPDEDTLSELARLPNVISVGATTTDGALLRSSSRGRRGGPAPTLVADGTDTMDEPFPPGTSFAAARVAHWCVYLRSLLHWMTAEFTANRDGTWPAPMPAPSRLAHLDTGVDPDAAESQAAQRRSLTYAMEGDAYLEYLYGSHRRAWMARVTEGLSAADLHFDLDWSPGNVRLVLECIADRRPCRDPIGCGAGFVSDDGVTAFLSDMTPSRFHAVFGERTPAEGAERNLLSRLDEELGPLWPSATLFVVRHEYLNKYEEVFVRVMR
jgi:hypothetical protein